VYDRALATDAGRWWGRPVAEMRWQAELVRLCCDPVFLRGATAARSCSKWSWQP
jgi:hypothetical protein